jgi:exosortase A-associated hydrolase 1
VSDLEVYTEEVLRFGDAGTELVGILARPRTVPTLGVVIVPGGAQNRAGSARQFVSLSRALAGAGIAALRFDYRGMGDSAGPLPVFEAAGDDIGRAVDALHSACPTIRTFVAWGLCDGATAAILRAACDVRIAGIVGINPWARSPAGHSAALVSTYYRDRLVSRAFWGRVMRGEVAVWSSLTGAVRHVRAAMRASAPARVHAGPDMAPDDLPARLADRARPLPARIHEALAARPLPLLAFVSPGDLTGTEFEALMRERGVLARPGIEIVQMDRGDHSLSRREDWDIAVARTIRWVLGLA